MKSPEPAAGLKELNSQLYLGLAGGLRKVADIYLLSLESVGGASGAVIHGVPKSWTRLSN